MFSFPEAASVGLTVEQAQAREDLIEIKETNYPMLANARMLMSGTAGSLTIVSGCDAANPDTPRVLGVHILQEELGIPTVGIEKEYTLAGAGQLRTRIQAFVESLEIKHIQGGKL